MSVSGTFRPIVQRARMSVVGVIVLQKSFSTTDQKFAGLWMRFSIQYVRDLIAE
jgi:hypothetical protein